MCAAPGCLLLQLLHRGTPEHQSGSRLTALELLGATYMAKKQDLLKVLKLSVWAMQLYQGAHLPKPSSPSWSSPLTLPGR